MGHTKIDENAETIENYPIHGVPFLYKTHLTSKTLKSSVKGLKEALNRRR